LASFSTATAELAVAEPETSYLNVADRRITYIKQQGDDSKPGLIYLHGFNSHMENSQTRALSQFAHEQDQSLIRFDLSCSGKSPYPLGKASYDIWLEESLAVLDDLTEGPQNLVGHSNGAWLALLLAIRRPERVRSLVLLAPACNLLGKYYKVFYKQCTEKEQQKLDGGGVVLKTTKHHGDVPLIKRIAENSERYDIDFDSPLPVSCPVRIVEGLRDNYVPEGQSLKLLKCISGTDASITYRKLGLHQMLEEEDLYLMLQAVESVNNK